MDQEVNEIKSKLTDLESKLNSILERNRKVELEKAWETSAARKITIVILTYLLMTLVFYVIGIKEFMLNAIIPTLGYYLSTQSVPILKKRWLAWVAQGKQDGN